MTLALHCNLGGSASRYKGGRLVRVTFLDPWAKKHLEFESPRLSCLWLLRQADRRVGPLTVATVAVSKKGRHRQCLRWRDCNGQIAYEALATNERSAAELKAANIRVTTWSSVLDKQIVWRNVDFLRMAAVQWLDVCLDREIDCLRDAVCSMPGASVLMLRAQQECLASIPDGQLLAAVSQAWYQQLIDINLTHTYSFMSEVRPGGATGELK